MFSLNKKLLFNIKELKQKIVEIKERYNRKVRRAKQYGVSELEMTMPRFETEGTDDYRQITDDMDFEDYRSNDSYGNTKGYDKTQLKVAHTMMNNDHSFSEAKDESIKERKSSTNILEIDDYVSTVSQPMVSSSKDCLEKIMKPNPHPRKSISKFAKQAYDTESREIKLQIPSKSRSKNNRLMARIQTQDRRH